MTPFEREEMKRRAQVKLAAIRERARRLRRRVLSGAATGFAVLWVAIFTQMITGHDPVLGPAAATVRPAAKEVAAPRPEAPIASGGEDDDEVVAPLEETVEPPPEEVEEELEPATTGQS